MKVACFYVICNFKNSNYLALGKVTVTFWANGSPCRAPVWLVAALVSHSLRRDCLSDSREQF